MKTHIAALMLIVAAGLQAQSTSGAAAAAAGRREMVWRDDALKVKPLFLPLPPGAVKPRGWLRDWARDAANGLTGHLDEYSKVFSEAWKGHAFDAAGVNPDGTGWPLEQASYWLDGAIRLAYMLDDRELAGKIGKRLDTVVDGVLKGGDSFIYWRPKAALDDSFNNWAHSHMGRALVAYYQASGDPRVLQALMKTYAGYSAPDLRNGFGSVSGAVNLDPMIETYLLSGDRRVLERAVSYAGSAAYRELAAQWRRGEIPPGHNVIFYENIRIPAMLYPWTGDKGDLGATLKALEWHERYMLPFGLSSGEEWHAGIGATRNAETCNVPASMWTYLWLLRATGDAAYSDRIEKVFFNAGPAPVGRDFKTLCYYQSPNRYSASVPSEEPKNPGLGAYQFTPVYHSVPCCVGNANRVVPFYVSHMFMATMDKGLAMTLYGPSSVRFTAGKGGVPVEVEAETSYPFEEQLTLRVKPDSPVAFPLYLRIPSWSAAPQFRVNGRALSVRPAGNGFVKIEREWRPDDRVAVRFPMSVRVEKDRETPYPQVQYFQPSRKLARDTAINSPYASVYYGPLLFALPIKDETPNREAPGARFGYALDSVGKAPVARTAMPAKWDWPLDAPLRLAVNVREFDWKPTEMQPLPADAVKGGRAGQAVLVPYGCTKFRVSMFPVTEEFWKGK